jgi:hypothetical protein
MCLYLQREQIQALYNMPTKQENMIPKITSCYRHKKDSEEFLISDFRYVLNVFFCDVLQRMKFNCQRFGTLCSIFIGEWVRSVTAVEKSVVRGRIWNRIVSRVG